ncbi:MAG: radical SAM protein [Candidatus Eisenbacteria bacterium]|nr:radical SAM protein [Candidatus Eisenbacteria bacterium]
MRAKSIPQTVRFAGGAPDADALDWGGTHRPADSGGPLEQPAYLSLISSGILEQRIAAAQAHLAACDLCPRSCGVDRIAGQFGTCATGRHAILASAGPHFGEERPLVGQGGSGTIFVAGCNLGCSFCQNAEISHDKLGREVTADEWADRMLALQAAGCHNINIVTPSHVVPALLEALAVAARGGLQLPLVYNSGGYDSVETLRLLEDVVDIYMPDFKFWDGAVAERYCGARDYPERAREALREMHRQVGDLTLDEAGVAVRGLLVRHLVLPEGLAGTEGLCGFLSVEISPQTYLNIMDQYYPAGRTAELGPLGRRITRAEHEEAIDAARAAGLDRLDPRAHFRA